jgi:enoyl-CoA hydratase/carnithine racemase
MRSLRDHFRKLREDSSVKIVVITGAGGNFCSGRRRARDHRPADQDEAAAAAGIHAHDRRPGEGDAPLPAAGDRRGRGRVRGAGAILAMASDLRYAAPSAKVAFLFVRVGLAGCDMGACAILPRIIGQGRAAELLYTGAR